MKKAIFAGALAAALCLTGAAGQRASAQDCPQQCQRGGDISFNVGFTLGCHWTPAHGHWVPNECNPCGYAPYGGAPYGYAPYGYPGYPMAAQPAPAPSAPALPAPKEEKKDTAGVQNIGYTYPGAYYDYNYNNAYGYPYYPDWGYGYGR